MLPFINDQSLDSYKYLPPSPFLSLSHCLSVSLSLTPPPHSVCLSLCLPPPFPSPSLSLSLPLSLPPPSLLQVLFGEFFVTSHGYMQDHQFMFNRRNLNTFGLLLADRVVGEFELEIKYIKAVRRLRRIPEFEK